MRNLLYIITGPTGVGKSDFALALARKCNGVILNGDVGQMYAPLAIGTAKPDWRTASVPHLLFDTIITPAHPSAAQYRNMLRTALEKVWHSGHTPIVVGGSQFYLLSLFFPPRSPMGNVTAIEAAPSPHASREQWQTLAAIDAHRASCIHPHDAYRIARALAIAQTGVQPSALRPHYDPLTTAFKVIELTRDRTDLYSRIDARTHDMLCAGWLAEARTLDPEWRALVRRKGLIGYAELFDLAPEASAPDALTIGSIQQATRRYAKRQCTFWRSFARKLEAVCPGSTRSYNLTLSPIDLYLGEILSYRNASKCSNST